jgi:hypothetical protein
MADRRRRKRGREGKRMGGRAGRFKRRGSTPDFLYQGTSFPRNEMYLNG